MSTRNKLYFASDIHLGAISYATSREREDRLIRWLDMIKADAAEIFLMGDLFDFWFEYKTVVPKGYIRFLGKLAELADSGIKIYLFKGNHDMWMFGYLEEECGVKLYHAPVHREWNGKKFIIGHGDGLGPGDRVGLDAEDVQPRVGLRSASPQLHQGQDVQARAETQLADHETSPPLPGAGKAAALQEYGPRFGQAVLGREVHVAIETGSGLAVLGPGQRRLRAHGGIIADKRKGPPQRAALRLER